MSNTTYDHDADQEHDLSRIRSAETNADGPGGADEQSGPKSYDNAGPGQKLAQQETDAADDTVGNGYTPSGPHGKDTPLKVRVSKRWWNKRKAKIAGGIAGIGVTGGVLGVSLLSGPLEFIHLAEILHNAHFSQQEDASDGRMGKLYRYFRKGGDAGQTRLGWLESKYNDKIIGQLKGVGLDPKFNATTGFFEGVGVDTTNEKSPYAGMTEEQAHAAIQNDYGGKVNNLGDGKFTVDHVGENYRVQKNALKTTVKATGVSKGPTAARTRVLKRYGMVTWHPLQKADKAITNGAKDYFKKKWENRVKSGTEPAAFDGNAGSQEEETTDRDGKKTTTTTPLDGSEQAGAGARSKSTLSKIASSKSVGVAGGLAAVAGIACMLKSLDDNIGQIKYAQVILPMIRVGMDAITVGEQIKSGQDVDPAELAYLSHFFNSTNSKGQDVSWRDSAPVNADVGQSGGIDLNSGIKESLAQGKPSWLDWTQNNPAMNGVCSGVGQAITSVISFGIGVISGGVISTLVGTIASAIAVPKLIDYVGGLLAGDALNIATLAGADYGSVADFGATMGANAASFAMGGVQLAASAVSENNAISTQEQKTAFDSESFFARTFDVYDYHSLAAVMLSGASNSFTRNLANVGTGLGGTLSSVLHTPLKLYASTVHAAPQPYQYPFPIIGFSQADLNNTAVANPYANAQDVATLLDNSCLNSDGSTKSSCDYISKASSCFGVNITKDNPDHVWDVIPNSDKVNETLYEDHGSLSDCADSNDTNWLKVRFFVLDTGVMEGYACADFDDSTSCSNNGEASSNSDGGSTGTPTTPTGDAASLAKQVLDNPNIKKSVSSAADLQAASQGQKVTPGPIGDGSSGLPGCSARTPTYLNPELLKTALNIAQKYKYQINDIVSGHDCDTGKHPIGRAMDIFYIDDKPLNDSWWSSASNVATINDIGTIVHNTGSYQFGFGVGCTAVTKIQSQGNLVVFNDSCSPQDEIHIDVRGAP